MILKREGTCSSIPQLLPGAPLLDQHMPRSLDLLPVRKMSKNNLIMHSCTRIHLYAATCVLVCMSR